MKQKISTSGQVASFIVVGAMCIGLVPAAIAGSVVAIRVLGVAGLFGLGYLTESLDEDSGHKVVDTVSRL